MAKSSEKKYGAKSIQVIEGLEAVRKRPAMYIGSTSVKGLHHLVYEIVDNSVDEALAGYCDDIKVTLYTDGSCSVEDNGRGIPVDMHPSEGVSAAQVVMTKLHAGGKFDKDTYKYSGGLHGVGVSVTNALSEKLDLEIYRDGKKYVQSYEKGQPLGPLKEVGNTRKRGTFIRFYPDPSIFTDTTVFSFDTLSTRLRELAFLNKGLRISLADKINDKKNEFFFEGGIISFVKHINGKKTPLFPEVIYFEQEDEKYVLEAALQYNTGYGEQLYSFVNNINTIEGGTHVSGFKSALTKVSNKYGQENKILKSGESLSSEDTREGLVCVINVKVPEPQFEGQTKTKLGNSEVKGIIDSWSFAALTQYFEEHPHVAKAILQKALVARRARDAAKKAREIARRKTALESTILPGKLADCVNEDPKKTELFIVEGDSAGGSAKQARDRFNQAILPLKGKILNVEKARLDRMLANDEIKALISAIGSGIGAQEFDPDKARYHKIILMTDADVDGSHIRTLLLTFFFRYMKPLIERGYLYIAQPPLYKVKIGKREQYIKDDTAFKDFLYDWAREHTTLTIDKKQLDEKEWTQLLKDVDIYEEQLENASIRYKVASDNAHKLVTFMHNHPWHEEDGIATLEKNLKQYFKNLEVSIKTTTYEEEIVSDDGENVETTSSETHTIHFKILNKRWSVSSAFLISPEMKVLLQLLQPLMNVENNEWKLKVVDRERSITQRGLTNLVRAISAISKPYMHVQRYKGLGEMNPEQLWETSMDSETRQMVQVNLDDEIEADSWFATLMGDNVSGRRDYIKEHGQFVKNLDV